MQFGYIDIDFSAINWDAWQIVIIGQLIVFAALLMIYFIFRYALPAIFKIKLRNLAKKTGKGVEELHKEVPADMNAAIALAIYMYYSELHDEESNVITINRVSRTYSPWSSKLYNMRNWH